MMPRSKLAFWILVAAAVVAVLWTFWFPYSEGRLYTAVPGYSTFVSSHDDLGKRWDELLDSGVGTVLGSVMGVDRTEDLKSGAVRAAVKLFAGEKALVAYVPGVQSRKGTWIAASWVGGRSQLIRWNLVHPFVRGLRKESMSRGMSCWVYGSGQAQAVFTFRDGYLLAVKGDDRDLLQTMVSRLDSYSRGDDSITGARLKRAAEAFDGQGDLAWCLSAVSLSSDGSCLMALEPRDDGVMLHASLTKQLSATGSGAAAAGDAVEVCGNLVDAVVVSSWKTLFDSLGDKAKADPVISFLNDVAIEDANVAVSVMRHEFSGRMYNLKVPVLLAGVQVKDDLDVPDRVHKLMDRLNAEKGLGVIPVKMPTENGPMIVAGGSKMNLFGGTKERPALAVRDGWLLVCSDMESLLHVMQGWADQDPVEAPRWSQLLSAAGGEAGAYINFTASELSIRNAIAVYTLFLIAEGEGTAERRAGLDALRSFVESMADVGEVVATATTSEDSLSLSVLLGSEEGL